MRRARGLDGNSATGTWIVHVGGERAVGPFNGHAPAATFARGLRADGVTCVLEQLWSPTDVREAILVRDHVSAS